MQQTLQKQAHKTGQKNAWKYILSAVIILIYILPIYVLVNMAFKHPTDLGSRLLPPTYFDISNFTSIIESGKLFRALGNTVLIAVGTVAIEARVPAAWRPMRSRATAPGSTASCRASVWAS